jgi:hypothetical protein
VIVTVAVGAATVLPATVAEMATAPMGTTAGAWYIPLDEIVPIAALPPTTPFTAQETAAPAGAPVKVNCWVPVVESLTVEA